MSCSTILLVEYDENNHRVDWHLQCSGDCPDGKKCKPVRHGPENTPDGWERYIHECACKQEGDEHRGECKLIVFEDIKNEEGKTKTRFRGKCLGHCPHTTTHCRPFLVKEFKIAAGDDEQFELDNTTFHTIRQYKCICPEEVF